MTLSNLGLLCQFSYSGLVGSNNMALGVEIMAPGPDIVHWLKFRGT